MTTPRFRAEPIPGSTHGWDVIDRQGGTMLDQPATAEQAAQLRDQLNAQVAETGCPKQCLDADDCRASLVSPCPQRRYAEPTTRACGHGDGLQGCCKTCHGCYSCDACYCGED